MKQRGPVVVGFTPTAPAQVLSEAVALSRAFGVPLIVAYCDPSRVVEGVREDGTQMIAPVDADTAALIDDAPAPEVAEVEARVRALCAEFSDDADADAGAGTGAGAGALNIQVQGLLGDPATVLAELADHVGAGFVVVGGRGVGWRGSVHALLSGSVALHLSTRQAATVVVVPDVAGGE